MQAALAEPAKRAQLRGLIERVTVRAAESGFAIELIGAIARIVEAGLYDRNKKAASLDQPIQ